MSRPQSLNVPSSQELSQPPQLRPRKFNRANASNSTRPSSVSAEAGTVSPDTCTRQMSRHLTAAKQSENPPKSQSICQPSIAPTNQKPSPSVFSDEFPPVVECLVPLIGRLECPCCSSQPKTVSDLKTHLRRVHHISQLITPTTCYLCQRKFNSFQAASRHYTACSRKHGISPTKSDLAGAASTQASSASTSSEPEDIKPASSPPSSPSSQPSPTSHQSSPSQAQSPPSLRIQDSPTLFPSSPVNLTPCPVNSNPDLQSTSEPQPQESPLRSPHQLPSDLDSPIPSPPTPIRLTPVEPSQDIILRFLRETAAQIPLVTPPMDRPSSSSAAATSQHPTSPPDRRFDLQAPRSMQRRPTSADFFSRPANQTIGDTLLSHIHDQLLPVLEDHTDSQATPPPSQPPPPRSSPTLPPGPTTPPHANPPSAPRP